MPRRRAARGKARSGASSAVRENQGKALGRLRGRTQHVAVLASNLHQLAVQRRAQRQAVDWLEQLRDGGWQRVAPRRHLQATEAGEAASCCSLP